MFVCLCKRDIRLRQMTDLNLINKTAAAAAALPPLSLPIADSLAFIRRSIVLLVGL